ncbi:MAG TPA: alpha-hydroxy acid oxidase [Parvularculaceae bacterium]|nr:alpha-hydroxy acid oxidase [Parvularculaceae bacterium]
MKSVPSIEDLRALARRKVPRAFFDYLDGGSYNEETLRANRADLEKIKLRQRVLVDVSERSLKTTIVGEESSAPFALAPVGLTGLQRGDGEILAAEAAAEAGVPYILSTMSICSIEDVANATKKPFWFQLYVIKDRTFSEDILARAKAAGCNTLVLTVDLQVLGQRHKDIRNGLTVPPKLRFGNFLDIATKQGWALSMLKAKRRNFGNLAGHVRGMEKTSELAQWVAAQFDPALSWKDVEWIRSIWPGKLVIKGILDVEDAKVAVRLGADALVVSNHGGRQLDGAPSSISVLPRVAEAVGGDIEVIFDGGIRTGADIFRALGLGARSCLIGRAYVYGLGAGGKAGVTRAIEILKNELSVAMALTGVSRISDVGRQVIAVE